MAGDRTPVLRADAADDDLDTEPEDDGEVVPGGPEEGTPVAYELPGGGWGIRYE